MRPTQTSTRRWPTVLSVPLTLMLVLLLAVPQVVSSELTVAWDRLDQKLGQYASASNLLVAEFSDDRCQTIHARNADKQLAIASTFKVYVLGEVARQVRKSTLSWDTPVTISDGLRSMPSGDYAWMPAGQQATVQDLAEAMMAYSDNTATDHLIDLLGREHVEDAFAAYGHSDPTASEPLLLTRELFAIKMWRTAEWMARYVAASDAEQLQLLTSEIDVMILNPSGGWGNWHGPTAIDGIEWFASAEDLCRAMTTLWTIGDEPGLEPVRDVLSRNRGDVVDATTWPEVGSKSGYEAGVVNATYVLERNDDRLFFVSVGLNSSKWVVDQSAPRVLLGPVFTCLASNQQPGDCET